MTNRLGNENSHTPVVVERPEDVVRLAERLARSPLIGIDTESNSMHCYFEKVCFLQIQAGQETFIVDTVRIRDLSPLLPVMADPGIKKVLHGADYDVVCLRRDFGLTFRNLFDTMLAAQLLEKPGLGLAALCEAYFQVKLDKSLTRHNWGQRPLEAKYLRYLVEDVLHLERLHEILSGELAERDLAEEAGCEFARVGDLEWKPKEVDPDRFMRVKGAQDLDALERTVLRELFNARETLARELDFPPFMVVAPERMLLVAKRRPQAFRDFVDMVRPPRRSSEAEVRSLFDAVQRAVKGEVPLEEKKRRPRARPDPRLAQCEDDLRAWRGARAAIEKKPPFAILPNHLIAAILDKRPRSVAEFSELPYVGARRAERNGPEVVEIVARAFGAAD